MSVKVDRSLELPESEYFAERQAKSGIALLRATSSHTRATRPFRAATSPNSTCPASSFPPSSASWPQP
jgi:hypothetical protein